MTENEDLLSTSQVARMLGVHRTTVAGWIRDGVLLAINVRSATAKRPLYKVRREKVERMLLENDPES